MKTALRLSLFLLLGFLASGCITVMKKDSFDNSLNSAVDSGKRAQDDYASKASMLGDILKKTSTPRSQPYPEMAADLGKMKAGLDKISASCNGLTADRKKFDDLCDGRPDLSSDRPSTWAPFMALYDGSKVRLAVLNALLQAHSEASNHYADLCNKHGISRIDAKDVRGQLSGKLGELDKMVGEVHRQTGDLRSKLKDQTIKTLGLVQNKDRHAILDKMDALASQLEAKAAATKSKVAAFDASIRGIDVIWRGPGIPKVEIVDEVVKDFKEISALAGQINDQVGQWNSMNH